MEDREYRTTWVDGKSRIQKRVHITDAAGKPLYNRLWDDGIGNVLPFESNYGFIDRLDIARYGWQVRDGWSA